MEIDNDPGSAEHIPDLPVGTSAIHYQPDEAELAARTAQIDVSAEEVSPKPSDNVPLAEEPVNGAETDEHSVDEDLFKPPTTPADFYSVGGPPADNGSDAGHDSADDIWGPETEDNVNEPEAPVEELDGIQGNDGNIARNIVKLATFCGLSAKELTKLMSEEPFTTMFQLINEKVFEPARQQAIRTMKPRPRMMDLRTVVAGLDAGESHGNQRYSNPQPGEQDRWSDLDHHANFLHQMRTQFYKRRGGFLFGRSLNDDEANQRIWLILKRADANLAPSRQKRQAEKAKRQLRGLENDTPGRSKTKAASSRSKGVVGKASGKAALDNDPVLDSIVDSVIDGDNADDESDVEVLVEDMAVDDNTFRATAEDPAYVSGQMRAELPDEDVSTPNYSYRYWQYRHMRALTTNYHSAVEAAERITTNVAADKLNDIGLEEGLATAQADEDQEADDVDTDIVCMGEATPTELENAERLSRLLSNSKYQRDNLKQSLNALRIQDRRFPRLPGQSLGCPLRWWQIVGANAIATARKQRKMRGMILADIVGLGKTFQVAAYMLHCITERARKLKQAGESGDRARVKALGSAKPFLVIVPLALVEQWIEELQRFSELFNVHVYHKKSVTQKTTTTGVTRIVESFKNTDDLFSGDEWTSRVVVISTYGVIASRHGPNALQKWRKARLGKGVKLDPKLFEVPERSWEHDLQYCWHTIILDEAHNVRNSDCLASIAVVNMDCRFNVLVSATPLFSGIRDNFGLLKIIQPIFKFSYPVSGPDGTMFGRNDDPFVVPDDHPAAIFRLTAGSFSAFVLNLTDSVEQGKRLEAIWQHCLLCRRYTSCCPIDSGKNEIGGALPRCETVILDLELPPPAQKVYDHFSEGFLKKLMATDQTRSGDNRVIINANSYRALVLMSTWPLLALSQPAMNPPRNKQTWSKRSRVLFSLEQSIAKHPALQLIPANRKLPESPQDVLKTIAIALQNSSRLSALVANIADQVVKRKEKAIIWTLYPLEQLIVREILVAFGIDARLLASDLAQGQKSDLVKNFNTPGICNVLIASYTANGAGLNLQQACHNVHLFDPAPSASAQEQAVGRSYRLGQSRKVTVVEYYVRKTFNERVVNNQILRALPGLMAMIGDESMTRAFGGESDETPRGPVDTTFDPASLQGFYVDGDGLLWHSSNPEIPVDLLSEDPLDPDEVLIKFFSTNRGRRVYQHGGFGEAFQEMHIDAPSPTPDRSTSKRGSTKRKRDDSGDDEPSDTNTDKPSKTENTRKASKPKPKPKATPTATAASTRKTRATATRAAPPKKRAKDAKTTATSPTAGAEAADAKPKPRRKARTDVDRNVGRMLPPGPGPDFA